MKYQIQVTESAQGDLSHFPAHLQRLIVAGILVHLKTGAESETKRKKRLRPNSLVPWELRLGQFRVFYLIEADSCVKVLAIGKKQH
jgi:mRNA-degrading endonuclease RelE of RelBE toxin-antitoxin system